MEASDRKFIVKYYNHGINTYILKPTNGTIITRYIFPENVGVKLNHAHLSPFKCMPLIVVGEFGGSWGSFIICTCKIISMTLQKKWIIYEKYDITFINSPLRWDIFFRIVNQSDFSRHICLNNFFSHNFELSWWEKHSNDPLQCL